MPKLYEISSIQFHDMIHMQGVNLGDKIVAKVRKAQIFLDLDFQTVWINFNGKTSGIPLPSVKSYDLVEVPDYVTKVIEAQIQLLQIQIAPVVDLDFVPQESDTSPEAHRARVRAASANSNKLDPRVIKDDLIQQARGQAMGFKGAQVSNPTMPKEGQTGLSLTTKTKPVSHAALKAQLDAEK